MLFDRENDPQELNDLGASTATEHVAIMALMEERLNAWSRRLSQRTSRSENGVLKMRGVSRRKGIVLGLYDGSEAPDELTDYFHGTASQRFVD